jgi:CubicO group peptidase (beta-lactamase class C family)
MVERIQERLEEAVTEGVFPGCVVGVIVDEEQFIIPVGSQTYESDAIRITDDSVYDIASITKAIPVSCLALKLIDDGHLSLEQKVREIIPELQTNYIDEITVWHLLTQTLDFTLPLSSFKDLPPDDILREILTTKFSRPPGERMNYANGTSILLGMVLQRVTGMKLDRLAREIFFDPLGMNTTTFHPEDLAKVQIVPTEIDPWRGRMIQGEVHDETAFRLREIMIPGSSGLFSTVPDLLRFVDMLLPRGVWQRRRYFTEKMITSMMTNELTRIGAYGSLGWELNQPRYMGKYCSEQMIGKTGFTGCVIIVDIPKNRGLIMLSNYHFPKRKKSVDSLNIVRREIADIVFSA